MSNALEKAIEIWRGRASISSFNEYNYAECPLCNAHNDCIGCPVFKKTGETQCEATPFYEAFDARQEKNLPLFKAKATEMVELLESCR
jgi:hypothetical protein